MQTVIDIPEVIIEFVQTNGCLSVNYDDEIATAIANGTPIPENATNGDVINVMFPYGKYNEYFADVEMKTEENDTRFKSVFDRDWWDEPYQKGGTNEKQV